MKNKVRDITSRNNGISYEALKLKLKQYVVGWVNYFKLANMKNLLLGTDEWLRRRLRMFIWKRWKKIKTRYRMIQKFGMPKRKVCESANCRKGSWRAAIMRNSVFANKETASRGYRSMAGYYLKIREN